MVLAALYESKFEHGFIFFLDSSRRGFSFVLLIDDLAELQWNDC